MTASQREEEPQEVAGMPQIRHTIDLEAEMVRIYREMAAIDSTLAAIRYLRQQAQG